MNNDFDNRYHNISYNQSSQSGSGFFDNLIAKGLNLIPSADGKKHPVFPGERHAPLKLRRGFGIASYVGPGTQVIRRLKADIEPRTEVDKTAKRHDIDYTLAQTSKTKKEQQNAVRTADRRMIKSLNRIQKQKKDHPLNIKVGRLISAKMIAENIGIMNKGSFGGPLEPNMDEDEIALLEKHKGQLEQEGYGIVLPGDDLRATLMKQHGKKTKKRKNLQKGGSLDLISKIVPTLAKNLGIDITADAVKKAISPAGDSISKMAKALLPLLVSHSLKSADVQPTAKAVKEILKGNTKDLGKKLKVVLGQIIKQAKGEQSGTGLVGSGFWDGFKRGFMSIMKPALNVLAPLSFALGPEIGIPMTVAAAIANNV